MRTRKPNEIPKALKSIDVKAVMRSRGIYIEQKINRDLKEAAMDTARQIIRNRKKTVADPPIHAQFSNDELMTYWEKQIHIVDILEKKFTMKVEQFIGKIVNDFLSHLESEIATTKRLKKWQMKDYFSDNEDNLKAQAQLDFTPLLIDQAVLAGQEAFKLIGMDDIYTPFALRKQITENVTKFTDSMLETDRQKLIDLVTGGIENGDSIPAIRGAIQNAFETIQKNQAQLITRTEVLRASNQGALDAYKQSGVVEGKQWLTAGATDECAAFEGMVESLGGSFYSSESAFTDGDPPLHPNCRCVLIPVLTDQKAYEPETKALRARIIELESQFDKRTKEFKELQGERSDDKVYIKSLEAHLGLDDDKRSNTEPE